MNATQSVIVLLLALLLLGRHGGDFLCRVERKNKMAATYNVLAFKPGSNADISPGDEFYTSKDT